MTLLSTVEDVFEIEGRGCVITPGLGSSTPSPLPIRRSDPISLHRPDGSIIETHVHAIEFLHGSQHRSCFPILLPPNITKADVPIGTEVWYLPTSDAADSNNRNA